MKNLTREQIQTKLNLAQRLSEVGEELQDAITRHNLLLDAAHTEIEALAGRYNEVRQEAQDFIEGIHEEQEAYSSDRSDQWREGDAGQAYEEWKDAWGIDLEEVGITLPDEIDEVTLDAVEVLRVLPDHP
jgi:uncharacterized protein YukE